MTRQTSIIPAPASAHAVTEPEGQRVVLCLACCDLLNAGAALVDGKSGREVVVRAGGIARLRRPGKPRRG